MLRAASRTLLSPSCRAVVVEAAATQQAVAAAHLPWGQALACVPQWVRPFSASRCAAQQQPPPGGAASASEAAGQQPQEVEDEQQQPSSSADEEEGGIADAAELQALLAKTQEEAAAFKDRWQRTQAEMANLIARQNREKETLQTYAVQKFAESLLEVADNLESAGRAVPHDVLQEGAQVAPETALKYLRALQQGVTATERVLLKTMGSKGVQRIPTAEGDAFDPNTQEAMSTLPCPGGNDKQPGTVANVWQSGYKIHDRILRAAKVIVYQE